MGLRPGTKRRLDEGETLPGKGDGEAGNGVVSLLPTNNCSGKGRDATVYQLCDIGLLP